MISRSELTLLCYQIIGIPPDGNHFRLPALINMAALRLFKDGEISGHRAQEVRAAMNALDRDEFL